MTHTASIETQRDPSVNITTFRRYVRASNPSPHLEKTYGEAVDQFASFLRDQGMPQVLAHMRREHVESFIAHLLQRWTPATAANWFGGLRAFWKFSVEEGEFKPDASR